MAAIEAIVCPACEQLVEPMRRKLPSAQVTTEKGSTKYAVPTLAFGHFCPLDGCGVRLDRAMEKAQTETAEHDRPEHVEEPTIEPAKVVPLPERRPAISQVRQVKPATDEDLFCRIRREHDEVCREEQELTARIARVVERRKKLDLLIGAMDAAQESIAAE